MGVKPPGAPPQTSLRSLRTLLCFGSARMGHVNPRPRAPHPAPSAERHRLTPSASKVRGDMHKIHAKVKEYDHNIFVIDPDEL